MKISLREKLIAEIETAAWGAHREINIIVDATKAEDLSPEELVRVKKFVAKARAILQDVMENIV